MSKHTIEGVLIKLRRKNDVRVNENTRTIQILVGNKAKDDLGNGSHGMIDYLVNHCGYRRVTVSDW